jgi:hypothetical protein
LHGDGVAPENFVERLDRISLFALVSSTLLLVVTAWQIPAYPDGLAPVCRSRPDDAARTTASAATTPKAAPAGTRSATP